MINTGAAIITSGGFNVLNKKYELISEILPAGPGGIVDLPGPDVGFLRLFDTVQAISDTIAAPLANARGGIRSGGIDYRLTGNISGTNSNGASQGYVIGNGETIRFYNDGANPGRIQGTYIDIPAGNLTLVRMLLDNTAQVVIPQPPSGYYSRWLQFYQAIFTARNIASRVQIFNADSVSQTFRFLLNNVLIGRTNITSLTTGTFPPLPNVAVTNNSGDMAVQMDNNFTTTAPHIIGAYETLPIS